MGLGQGLATNLDGGVGGTRGFVSLRCLGTKANYTAAGGAEWRLLWLTCPAHMAKNANIVLVHKYTIYLDEQQRQQEPHDSAPKTAASAFRCWGNGAGAAEGAVAGP